MSEEYAYADDDEEDEDPFTRENLEMAVECSHESADMSVEKAMLALYDLEGHPAYERSNALVLLTGLYLVALQNVKSTEDYMGFSNMVAERQMALAPYIFEKIEEVLPRIIKALDELGKQHDDFIQLYVEHVKTMVHELMTGRPAPPRG